jgi:hypothetical protein
MLQTSHCIPTRHPLPFAGWSGGDQPGSTSPAAVGNGGGLAAAGHAAVPRRGGELRWAR